jgi:hypothetical protein
MGKKSVIEQLRSAGAVAAHANGRWVTSVKGSPRRVTLANPLYLDKKKLGIGDKIAIVDTGDYSSAFLCRVSRVETGQLSNTLTLDLVVLRTLELAD